MRSLSFVLMLVAALRVVSAEPTVRLSAMSPGLAGSPPPAAAMVVSDLNRDLHPDLVLARSTEDGCELAVALGEASFDGHDPNAAQTPFGVAAWARRVPVAPELLMAGDVDHDGFPDVVVAQRGARELWVLPGDGVGGLAQPTRLALAGPLTAATTGDLGRVDHRQDLTVAVNDPPRLLRWDRGVHRQADTLALETPARALTVARLDDDDLADVVAIGERSVCLAVGVDRRLVHAGLQAAPPVRSLLLRTDTELRGAVSITSVRQGRDGVRVLTAEGQLAALEADEAGLALRPQTTFVASDVQLTGGFRTDPIVVDRRAGTVIQLDDSTDRAAMDVRMSQPVAAAQAVRLNRDAVADLVVLTADGTVGVVLSTPEKIFTVDSVGDEPDSVPWDGICSSTAATCTLRAAIEQANSTAALDEIRFNLPGSEPYVIAPATGLPNITSPTTIDGSTQPGTGATPTVIIDGSSASGGLIGGMTLQGGSHYVSTLAIGGFSNFGLRIVNGDGDMVRYLWAGCAPDRSLGNDREGILIADSVWTDLGYLNVADNGLDGIAVIGTSDSARIAHAAIGYHNQATAAIGNDDYGVRIDGASATFFWLSTVANNGLSGFGGGIGIEGGADSTGLAFLTIRAQAPGTGNNEGVVVSDGATSTTIEKTTIVDSAFDGIEIDGSTTTGTVVTDSSIGVAEGVARPNGLGVYVFEASSTLIGDDDVHRTVISGNTGHGVLIEDAVDGTVIGEVAIGVDADGTTSLPNGSNGLYIFTSDDVEVGFGSGSRAQQAIIGGNQGFGLACTSSSNVVVDGALIGVSAGVGAENDGGASISCDSVALSNTTVSGNARFGVAINGIDISVGSSDIHDNDGPGVEITGISEGVDLPRTVLTGNTGLEIDLGGDGPTANDPGDSDTGPNRLQNSPRIVASATCGAVNAVTVEVDTTPSIAGCFELYSSAGCDTGGWGHAESWLGLDCGTTDASGHLEAEVPLSFVWSQPQLYLSARFSGPYGTSELSPCFLIEQASGDADSNGVLDAADIRDLVVAEHAPVAPLPGDCNHSGAIGADDIACVLCRIYAE
jgi:CSLREA domain-containing protein